MNMGCFIFVCWKTTQYTSEQLGLVNHIDTEASSCCVNSSLVTSEPQGLGCVSYNGAKLCHEIKEGKELLKIFFRTGPR